jgi:hypothetical protein
MKSPFKNLVMLILLLIGIFILVVLGAKIWNSMRGVSWVEQVPIWCRAVVVFSGAVWLVTCIIFTKTMALYRARMIQAASLQLFWPAMRFYNVIILRWRLIVGVAFVTAALVSLCSYATLPIYSSTSTIKQQDEGTLMMEFIKRNQNAFIYGY